MIDIDYFKQYNDTYGHVQGDECLRKVAAALSGSIHRENDLICRFEGRSFRYCSVTSTPLTPSRWVTV